MPKENGSNTASAIVELIPGKAPRVMPMMTPMTQSPSPIGSVSAWTNE